MSEAPQNASSGRAFFNPGGFARSAGQVVAPQERLRWLTQVFALLQLQGWRTRLIAASY